MSFEQYVVFSILLTEYFFNIKCESIIYEYASVSDTTVFKDHHELRLRPPPLFEERSLGAVTFGWVQQPRLHRNKELGVWKQLYYSSNQFFGSGSNGPVFLMLGGEEPANPIWLKYGSMFELAQHFNATMFLLEHRYYGYSQPTSDWSTTNLKKFLNCDEALEDASAFVDFAKDQYGLENSKWIVFGGSYAGCLSAWMRYKFPEKIAGAVSSSAPLEAKVNFKEYFKVIVDSIHSYDPECSNILSQTVSDMEEMFANYHADQLSAKFNVCPPLDPNNDKDVTWFLQSLLTTVAATVQYNEQNPLNPGIRTLCNTMNNASIGDCIDRYASFRNLTYGKTCLDFRYDRYVNSTRNATKDRVNGNRQWTFQTCNEFGYFQTLDEVGIFRRNWSTESFWVGICTDVFGEEFNAKSINEKINSTNEKYKGKNLVEFDIGNIVFATGTNDPWNLLGVSEATDESYSNRYTVISVEGMSHCEDQLAINHKNSEELTFARLQIIQIIAQWIAEGDKIIK